MAVTLQAADGKQRNAIMNSAMHLFGKQGFNGTSMRDIANSVGLLPGSLYAHIASKEALLFEIVAGGISQFNSAVETASASAEAPIEKLRRMIAAHVEVVADNPERSQVVFHQWRFLGPESLPDAIERRRQYETHFVDVIRRGCDEGVFKPSLNLRVTVLTILGALNWTPEWFSPDGRLSATALGELMADVLLGGILID